MNKIMIISTFFSFTASGLSKYEEKESVAKTDGICTVLILPCVRVHSTKAYTSEEQMLTGYSLVFPSSLRHMGDLITSRPTIKQEDLEGLLNSTELFRGC